MPCQLRHCIVLKVQCFYLQRSISPLVLLSTRDKRIAITFHENQRLNIGNQYQKGATQFVPKIIEKFEELHNVIPHRTDETKKGTTNKISKDSPSFRQDFLLYQKARDFLSRDTESSCKQRHLVKSRKFLSYCSAS